MKKFLALLAAAALAAPAAFAADADNADFDPFDLSAFEAPSAAPAADNADDADDADLVSAIAKPGDDAPAAIARDDDDSAECDARIQKLFDANDFKYEISAAGNFKAIMEFQSERTQLVIICSRTEFLGDMEIREVYSVAYDDTLTRSELSDLMQNSGTKKIGAWQLEDEGQLLFVAKIPAELSFDDLESVIWAVARTADDYEESALGTDEF